MAATVAMAEVCAHSLINRCHSPNTSPMQARINSSIHSHSVTAATVVSSNTADMVVATVVCRTNTNHNNTVAVDTANSTAAVRTAIRVNNTAVGYGQQYGGGYGNQNNYEVARIRYTDVLKKGSLIAPLCLTCFPLLDCFF
jgi:hypothetical protein